MSLCVCPIAWHVPHTSTLNLGLFSFKVQVTCTVTLSTVCTEMCYCSTPWTGDMCKKETLDKKKKKNSNFTDVFIHSNVCLGLKALLSRLLKKSPWQHRDLNQQPSNHGHGVMTCPWVWMSPTSEWLRHTPLVCLPHTSVQPAPPHPRLFAPHLRAVNVYTVCSCLLLPSALTPTVPSRFLQHECTTWREQRSRKEKKKG